MDNIKIKYNVFNYYITKIKIVILVNLLLVFSCAKEEAIPVAANFEISILNDDFSAPVHAAIINTTQGADTYNWTFQGGIPSSSSSKNPGTIIYNQAGNYIIRLDASNQDGNSEIKEISLNVNAELIVSFDTEIVDNNFPPMEVSITNTTIGAQTYSWVFQGGNITTSNQQNPENIVFNESGEHIISLEVSNGVETFQLQKTVTVAPHLEANFDYEVNFNDDDLQVPVTINIQNNSISATNYLWSFIGGNPSSSTEENPTVTFNTPGTYTLSLEATNGKETEMFEQEIIVVENTNIRNFQNIQLGINTAHTNNTIGAFFSTTNRTVYTKNQVTQENGGSIDLAFFGLNQNFIFNKFVAPDEVQSTTFDAIPNATHTKFINSLETCNCSASLSVTEFNNMIDDTQLAALLIEETVDGLQEFDNSILPRIVLFKTQDNRKGAIKLKDFVQNGQESYIIIDIKVQKEPN